MIGRRASLPLLLARTQGVPPRSSRRRCGRPLAAHVVEVGDDLRVDFHHPAFREVRRRPS